MLKAKFMKITASDFKEIIEDISKNFESNFITNVVMLNSSDFILTNSFNRNKKLFISLNHESPFVSLIEEDSSLKTVMCPLLETLRKEVKNSYIINVSVLNNDRIAVFDLVKNDDFFEKVQFKMVLELIPYRPNLLLLDKNSVITYAAHYSSLDSSRPIIKGMKYDAPAPLKNISSEKFNKEEYQKFVNEYFLYSISKQKKERGAKLYAVLKAKIKSINNKISKLEKESETAKNCSIYKEIGEFLYTIQDKAEIDTYLKDKPYQYDDNLSISQNAELCFKKYKKGKRTIEANIKEIEKAKEEINELSNIVNTFSYLDDYEIKDLEESYLKIKRKNNKNDIPSYLPSYIVYKGVKIAFGKNSKQNEYLTFKLAKKDYLFLHLANMPCNHVVIFDANANNDIIQKAAELVVLLSSFEDGEIFITKISNVKKGDKEGLVNLLNHKSIYIKQVNDETKNLLVTINRFSH